MNLPQKDLKKNLIKRKKRIRRLKVGHEFDIVDLNLLNEGTS
jgi:hypothetical protein